MSIDIDEAKVERNIFSLWLGWTLATALGMLLGFLPAVLFIQDISLGVARILVPLLAGILIGLAQWLVLRGYVTASHDWIINHTGGWVIGYMIGFFLVQYLSRNAIGSIIGFVLFGIIIAVFQYPVLRREIPHVWSWILANIVGWGLGALVSQFVLAALARSANPSLIGGTVLSTGITGLIGGSITGIALIWIVRKPDIAYAEPRGSGRERHVR